MVYSQSLLSFSDGAWYIVNEGERSKFNEMLEDLARIDTLQKYEWPCIFMNQMAESWKR